MKKKLIEDRPRNLDKYLIREYQLKFRIQASEDEFEEQLLCIGAKKLGTVMQKDHYYTHKRQSIQESTALMRLREESNEKTLFTFFRTDSDKSHDFRIKLIYDEEVNDNVAKVRLRDYRRVITLHKERTIYLIKDVTINIDKLVQPSLGLFIEFSTRNEETSNMSKIIKSMGFKSKDEITSTYYSIALSNMSPMQRVMQKICGVVGSMAFGISSAGLTILGLIIGVNAVMASKLLIIVTIACIAFADSMADAIGLYTQSRSEGISWKKSFNSAVNNFFGKLFFASSFMFPFFLFDIKIAIIIDLIWGFIILIFVKIIIAVIQDESKVKTVLKNVLIAIFVLIISFMIGASLNSLI